MSVLLLLVCLRLMGGNIVYVMLDRFWFECFVGCNGGWEVDLVMLFGDLDGFFIIVCKWLEWFFGDFEILDEFIFCFVLVIVG